MSAVIRCFITTDNQPYAVVAPGMHDLGCLLADIGDDATAIARVLGRIAEVESGKRPHATAWHGDGYWATVLNNTTVSIGLAVPGPVRSTLRLSLADFKDAMTKWSAVCNELNDRAAEADPTP